MHRLGCQGQHRALARRRDGHQLVLSQVRPQRRNPLAAVVGEVVDVQAPARGCGRLGDGPGQRAPVQRLRAAGRDLLQCRGEGGVAPTFARRRGGVGREVERLARDVEAAPGTSPQPPAGSADRGAVDRGRDGRLEQARPLAAAEALVQVPPARNRPGDGHRPSANGGHEPVPVVGDRLRVGAPSGAAAAVEHRDSLAGRDHSHGVASDTGGGGFHHTHDRIGRDGRVDRGSSLAEQRYRGLHGQRMPGSHCHRVRASTGRWHCRIRRPDALPLAAIVYSQSLWLPGSDTSPSPCPTSPRPRPSSSRPSA